VFVPDIRDHTANVAEIHCEDGQITDLGWFELVSEQFPGVYSKKSTDGIILFTDGKNISPIILGIKVADCWAITFSYRDKIFWVIHAGWKGVARGII
jgi:copper oxidase (laccase) domain-containing protein